MSSQYPYRNGPSQPPIPGPPAGSLPGASSVPVAGSVPGVGFVPGASSVPGAGSVPGAPSRAPKRGALRRLAPYSIIAIPAAFVATYVIMSNMDAYGTGMLTSTILLCCVGLVIVVGGIVAIVSSLGDLRTAKQSGDRRAYSRKRDSMGWATIGVLMIAAPTFFYLVPAAWDLFDGSQTRTVTSCSYDQDIVSSYRIPRNDTSFNNHFRGRHPPHLLHQDAKPRHFPAVRNHAAALPGVRPQPGQDSPHHRRVHAQHGPGGRATVLRFAGVLADLPRTLTDTPPRWRVLPRAGLVPHRRGRETPRETGAVRPG